jgi:hypothetical protein
VLIGQAIGCRPKRVGGSGTCCPKRNLRPPNEVWLPLPRRSRRRVLFGRPVVGGYGEGDRPQPVPVKVPSIRHSHPFLKSVAMTARRPF